MGEERRLARQRAMQAAAATRDFHEHHRVARVAADDLIAQLARERAATVQSPGAPAITPTARGQSKVLSGWLQYVGTVNHYGIVVTKNYQQILQCVPGQVMLFPFEVCQYLLTNQATFWTVQTVVPVGVATTHDVATGLDLMWVGGVDCWGVDTKSGYPYFDPDDGPANSENASMIVQGSQPSLVE